MGENNRFSGEFYPYFQLQYMLFSKKYAHLNFYRMISTAQTVQCRLFEGFSPHKVP